MEDDLERVRSELHWTLSAIAGSGRPIGPGWIFETEALPLVWTLNQLRINEPAGFPDIVALAEEHQGALPYRHVVADFPTSATIADEFAGAGWDVDREVLMSLTAEPDRAVDTDAVIELSEEQMLFLMRRWLTEDFPQVTSDGLDQLDEYNRREGRLWQERRFGMCDTAGSPLAVTKLRTHGPVSWVEDVYTVPEGRGRGAARQLVTHATDLARGAGSELTFIIADDNDWPKELYARIGFRPIGFAYTFHRSLGRDH